MCSRWGCLPVDPGLSLLTSLSLSSLSWGSPWAHLPTKSGNWLGYSYFLWGLWTPREHPCDPSSWGEAKSLPSIHFPSLFPTVLGHREDCTGLCRSIWGLRGGVLIAIHHSRVWEPQAVPWGCGIQHSRGWAWPPAKITSLCVEGCMLISKSSNQGLGVWGQSLGGPGSLSVPAEWQLCSWGHQPGTQTLDRPLGRDGQCGQ